MLCFSDNNYSDEEELYDDINMIKEYNNISFAINIYKIKKIE